MTGKPSTRAAKNAGRKRGGVKAPRTLDEALYGEHHEKAVFLVSEMCLRMARIPKEPDDRDPSEEETLMAWLQFVGKEMVNAMLLHDAALFAGMAKILRDNPPDANGDWNAVHPERVEASVIAMKQKEGMLPPLTLREFEIELAPSLPPHGDKRHTASRIAKDTGVQIIAGKRGRKPGKKQSR